MTGETKFVSDMDNELGNQFENYHKIDIHDLLDDYLKLVEQVKFREFRHNEFSENMELELWNKGFFRTIHPKFKKDHVNGTYITSFKKFDLEKSGIYDIETLFALCLRGEFGFSLLIADYDLLSAKGKELTKAINNFLNDD